MTPLLAQKPRSDRAFERLYRKHAGDVYRYALVVLRNPADAEDVTQTTFMNAYRAFERGERPRQPQNWLIAIAHNVCRQRFRQSQRRPNEVAFEEDLAEAVVAEDAISAEDIRRALGHLAFNQRAALVMRELEGRSYQEIADILEVSVSAVETLIFRARRALREQLEEGITCHEAELAISRQLDDRLTRKEKGALRAHLRECDECARFARSQRAHRGALKGLAAIPLPQSLASFFGGGGGATTAAAGGGTTALGSGLAVKAAALGAGAIVATGTGYVGVKHGILRTPPQRAAAAAPVEHAAPPPAANLTTTAPAVFAPPPRRAPSIDLKPFKPKAVAARSAAREKKTAKRAHPAAPGKQKHLEVSALPPSRTREHVKSPPGAKSQGHKTPKTHKTHKAQTTHKSHPLKRDRTSRPPRHEKPQAPRDHSRPPKSTLPPDETHGKTLP
jgi:RNA polymerase sigma-70 factor (ECF subfamily)